VSAAGATLEEEPITRVPTSLRWTAALVVLAASGTLATSSHTVQSGETLSGIAARQGTTVSALAQANDIADPDVVRAGQVLSVPAAGSSTAAAASGAGAGHHQVRAGESVTSIAETHGISTRQLVDANGLVDGTVYVGQRLSLGPAAPLTGSITCPVPGARFMNDWGFPRSGGRAHTGNDLFAPRGTPVAAPVSGTVTQRVGEIGGKQVRLDGQDGSVYHATHLDSFGAHGWVEAGSVIGHVGDTGNAVGGPPHVHFEVHPGGGPAVNPYPLLHAACR
jgi:murein DD-endopeptidase MepM/ murein hydrolase activator NlpD